MNKKLDELNNSENLVNQLKKLGDINSQEAQDFLNELHVRSLERQTKVKKMIKEWEEEDRRNENK